MKENKMNKSKYNWIIFALLSAVIILAAEFAYAQSTINLGTAGNFAILAKSGISITGTTSIIGNMGISPAAFSYI
ncbi:MAG: hypothetical protein AABX07_04235 [Nanoarchaeota archaeon]